jgi:hypothetical protein
MSAVFGLSNNGFGINILSVLIVFNDGIGPLLFLTINN